MQQLLAERFDDVGDVGDGHDEGRHEDDDVAERAEDDAAFAEAVADEMADAAGGIEGAASGFVFDEFEAGHEAFLADVADVEEVFEGLEELGELSGFLLDSLDEIIFFEQVE